MKGFVVDASVVVKWYIPEPMSEQAFVYLDLLRAGEVTVLAPDLVIAETGNVLWKKLRRGELTVDEARLVADAVATSFPAELMTSNELLPTALEIAVATRLTVYDCLYVALAVARQATLVTADRCLADAVQDTLLVGSVDLLAEPFSRP